MPQLDTSTYFSQIFWLVVCFVGLYAMFIRDVLPNIAKTLKARKKIIKLNSGDSNTYKADFEFDIATISKHIEAQKNHAFAFSNIIIHLATTELDNRLYKLSRGTLGKQVHINYLNKMSQMNALRYSYARIVK